MMTKYAFLKTFLCLLAVVLTALLCQAQDKRHDWLVNPISSNAHVYVKDNEISLENGLVKRTFRIRPNVTCVDYVNLVNGQQLLRAIKPEGSIVIGGRSYNIGGLYGQTENAYIQTDSIERYTAHEADLQFASYRISDLKPFIDWRPRGWAMNRLQPTGKVLTFAYRSSVEALKGISISVHYELYNGLPLIVKWLSIENGSPNSVTIGRTKNEILALVEEESAVVGTTEQMKKQHG
ncbi:MAG: alpha-galactosidase, partial [Bacteroidetes bacterium]|nr:alpha-galactosidase [Bacteroidota bacterium]